MGSRKGREKKAKIWRASESERKWKRGIAGIERESPVCSAAAAGRRLRNRSGLQAIFQDEEKGRAEGPAKREREGARLNLPKQERGGVTVKRKRPCSLSLVLSPF